MYRIDIDVDKNTLGIHLLEFFNSDEGKEMVCDLASKIKVLKPGFRLLTDLSKLRNMDFDAHNSIDAIMELCNNHEVSKVVRVIAKDTRDIGFNIMALFHYSHTVIIHTCDSLEAAKQELEIL